MILDKDLMFCENMTVTSSGAATTVLDLGEKGDAIGQELTIEARCVSSFASGGTIACKLQTGSASGSLTDVLTGPAQVGSAVVKGGTMFKVRVPQGLDRYVGMYFVVSGSVGSGAVTAFATKEL